jgi:hypothetical protein
MRSRALRLVRAAPEEVGWLRDTLGRISAPFGTEVDLDGYPPTLAITSGGYQPG